LANKKTLREIYRKRFHDQEKTTAPKTILDLKDDDSRVEDLPSETNKLTLRAESPLKERIDDRQDFKSKDQQKPKKKFQVVKRYQKQDESIRRKALKQKQKQKQKQKHKNKKSYTDKKSSKSKYEDNTYTNDDFKSSMFSDIKINVQKAQKVSTIPAAVIELKKETNFSKPKDKTRKNKFDQKNNRPQKPKGLKESKSRKGKLNHTAKDVSYSAHFISRKMDQFESQKDTDDNSAMLAANEGGEIVGRTLQNKTSKRRSKLKFDKAVREKHLSVSESKNKKSTRFKNTRLKQSKVNQKKNIKKTYSANKRLNYGGIKERFKDILKKTKEWAIKGLKKMGIYMIGPAFIFIISAVMLLSLLQSFSSGVSSIVSTSYQSDDVEITNSHLIYTGLEADLKYAIENVESDHSGYDEYKYSIDSIGHDIHLLMAYLTAKYEAFTASEVRNELNRIFNEQYDYRLTQVTEVRYRTVHHSSTDPETGATHSWTTQEPYNWYVLKVSLDTSDLESILLSNLDEDEKEFYDALVETKGNFTNLSNPFDEPWTNAVSSYFGYRLDPMSNEVTFHGGIDIAKPTGTELLSIIEGSVSKVGYDANGLGHYIIVENEKGQSILYGHCSSIEASLGDEVKVGNIIALVGSTGKSTGPHVHLEVRDSEGNKLNPYFYLTQE
jgi:murein DD-endopeptidase MepM/ murein hydrolase activator NlpD